MLLQSKNAAPIVIFTSLTTNRPPIPTTYPGGHVVTHTYTPRGEVASIGLDGSPLASYTYTPVSRLASKSLEPRQMGICEVDCHGQPAGRDERARTSQNGVATAYSYDAAQRLVGLSHHRGSTLLAGFTYTLDSVGNRLSKTQSGLLARTDTCAYDAVDQLLSAQYVGVGLARTVSYQYDAAGNRQWRNDAGTTTNYAVNPDNAYTQVGGAPASLDANGNHAGHAGATYTYDAQNRLTSATVNATTTTFTYDARNRVIQRTVASGAETNTTLLTYSGWNLIEERNRTGDLAQVYVHGAAMDELLVKFTPESAVYYHHDGLGSTIALTDETGQLLESYIYDAFCAASVIDSSGRSLPVSAFGNRFLFTGRELIPDTKLYDYRNRVYRPDLGRFLQPDPIRFSAGDGNLYRYVGNNPINYTDSSGLLIETIADIGFIAYDLYRIVKDNVLGDCDNLGENLGSLGGNIVGAAIPFATGGGLAVRAGMKSADAASSAAKGMTKDQRALKELVDEATSGERKPLPKDQAETVLDWAKETGYPGTRAKPGDVSTPSNWDANPVPHIHLPGAGRGGHVPVEPGVQPRP